MSVSTNKRDRYASWSTDHMQVRLALPGVVVVELARPPVNAMSGDLKLAMLALVERLSTEEAIRVVAFSSGIPGAFCAGSDLFELAAVHAEPGAGTERNELEYRLWQGISGLPQVTIAAIDGYALGGGLEFAVACDLRVASREAVFSLPEISIGGTPGIQVLARLTFLVGAGAARRLLLLGDRWSAADALTAGLVDRVADGDGAVAASLELASRLRDLSPTAVQFIKGALAKVVEPSQERVEAHLWAGIETVFRSPEMAEALGHIVKTREVRHHAARDRSQGHEN